MKKYFLIGLIIVIAPNFCFGAGARYTQLVREKQRKMEELEKCMGATNGLKIAGVSTLGLTAVGVAGNIAEAKKRDDLAASIESADKQLPEINENIKKAKIDEKQNKEENERKKNCEMSDGKWDENGYCNCPDDKPNMNFEGECFSNDKIQKNFL